MKTLLLVAGAGLVAFAVYYALRPSKVAVQANGNQPINALPARQYAINPNYSPQGQPPTPTFTTFSGVPIVEGLLRSFGGRSINQALSQGDSQPVSFDTTDTSSSTVSDSGTTTFFG